jgi:DNA methylase
MSWRVEHAPPIPLLRELPEGWAQSCVTAPPGWGSKEGFLGLEPTPAGYILHLVAVLRAVRRVLRADGTLWLNLRDSYDTSSPATFRRRHVPVGRPGRFLPTPAEEMLGLHLAAALCADGWTLQHGAAWTQPSVTQERTREYLLLLTKQPGFFYDTREAPQQDGRIRHGRLRFSDRRGERAQHEPSGARARQSWWQLTNGSPAADAFPRQLIERCIRAGSPPTACRICGAPWARDPDTDGGWHAGCAHLDSRGRCLVLDPFCGPGTVGVAAQRLGRHFLGIEEREASASITRHRLTTITPEARS